MSSSFPLRCILLFTVTIAGGSFVGCDRIAKTALKDTATKFAANAVSNSSQEDVRQMLAKTNACCPIRMDAFTTLEQIDIVDDLNVEYHYLVNDQGSKMLSRMKKRTLQKNGIEQMKGNPLAVAVAEHGLRVRHIYRNEAGRKILSYLIDKETLDGNYADVGQVRANAIDEPVAADESALEAEVVEDAAPEPPMPEDLTPKKKTKRKKGPESWQIQSNPFFEA